MSDRSRTARALACGPPNEPGETLSMNMPAMKTAPVTSVPASSAPVVAMTPKRPPRMDTYVKAAKETAVRVVPPLIVLALLMLFWELACRRAGSTLPPPSRVYKDTKELIFDPFFDRGGIDKGLFWHLSASLQRVALGYSLAAVAGVALGTLVGQSVWAMRGLDPLFQVLRTIPPLAWLPLSLAAFRDVHHLDLADHHQHRGRHPQHPAGLPQCRSGGSAQSAGILYEDHDPGGG